MTKTKKFSTIIMKMMESNTLDDAGNMQVIDEAGDAEAQELLGQLVLETARDWWAQMESTEDSLAAMSDEISFSEMNADPSHVTSPDLDIDNSTVESMLMGEDFNLDSILEMDEDEFGPSDGDNDFDDMMRGDDEDGLGDDMPIDDELDIEDGELDSLGGDVDDVDVDSSFDFSFLDDDEANFDDFSTDVGAEDELDEVCDHMDDKGDESEHYDFTDETDEA